MPLFAFLWNMTLVNISDGESVSVMRVDASPSLAARLEALGVFQNAVITLLKRSAGGKVYYLRTAFSCIAVGAEVASKIEVAK